MIDKLQPSLINPDTPESEEGIVAAIDAIEDKINELVKAYNEMESLVMTLTKATNTLQDNLIAELKDKMGE